MFNMEKKYEYYKASLPISLRTEIERLFEENPRIKNLYSNNLVRFIEDATREKIISLSKGKKDMLLEEFEKP